MNARRRGYRIGMFLFVALLATAGAGCKRGVSTADAAGEAEGEAEMQAKSVETAPAWRPGACKVSKAPGFHGKTPDEVVAEIGEPARKESFKMGERQDEFHVELQNTYPLSEPGNADVEVQEWSWKHGDCNLTLWLHAPKGAWFVFASLVWPDGVDF